MRFMIGAALCLLAPCVAAQTFMVMVSGIGGEAVYSERFRTHAQRMLEIAVSELGIPRERIIYLSEAPTPQSDGLAVKAELRAALARVAETADETDTVLLLLIGHGSARGDSAVFNLPGPDVDASELDSMLESLPAARLVVVNTAPASAPFIEALSSPGRVIITATASVAERYHTIFAEHFIAAFAGGADTDKDGRVSMLESFLYAQREVERSYAADSRLQSEHALLDDNGDGRGSTSELGAPNDGLLAGATYLESSLHALDAPSSDALRRLVRERERISEQVRALIAEKQTMASASYEERLEQLLVELALTTRAVRAARPKP